MILNSFYIYKFQITNPSTIHKYFKFTLFFSDQIYFFFISKIIIHIKFNSFFKREHHNCPHTIRFIINYNEQKRRINYFPKTIVVVSDNTADRFIYLFVLPFEKRRPKCNSAAMFRNGAALIPLLPHKVNKRILPIVFGGNLPGIWFENENTLG